MTKTQTYCDCCRTEIKPGDTIGKFTLLGWRRENPCNTGYDLCNICLAKLEKVLFIEKLFTVELP